MAYKSTRLLVEAIHKEMDETRKNLMRVDDVGERTDSADALERLNELRRLFDELAARADRPTIDDVMKLSPGDYVATMKPLVRVYHQQLMTVDQLCACLNEDLQANAAILMLIGDEKTVVRAAHDPSKPEAELAVEAILAALDDNTKAVVQQGVAEAENQLGIAPEESPPPEREGEEPT